MPRRARLLCFAMILLLLAGCQERATPTRRPPSTLTPTIALPTATPLPIDTPTWFRGAVLYQIFPRSFCDSGDDGIGDLNGITQKLDYLRSLDVTVIWLTSLYSSRSDDGAQVTDHLALAPDLGTQQDLITLVKEAHTRNMHVLIDLVAGRTSDKHPFFLEAYRKPDSFYSTWYQWDNAAQTAFKVADGNRSLPLLNMADVAVQRYMLEIAHYWMDLDDDGDLTDGIDGFVDDVRFAPPEFWAGLRTETKAVNPDFLLVGYAPEETVEALAPYYDQFDALLDSGLHAVLVANSARNGDGLLSGRGEPGALGRHLDAQARLFPPSAQIVRFLDSSTANRVVSEVQGDLARARQAAALILTLPGTPMIYYGQEIGMKGSLANGADGAKYRREPMDWYAAESGPGMTTWFKPKNRNNRPGDGLSVEEQTGQQGALLEFYRTLITLRRTYPALVLGGFQQVATAECKHCLAYWRWDESDAYLVVLNLTAETQTTTVDFTALPRPLRGVGQDVLRGGAVSIPSNGRYTSSIDANGIRILHWGKP